MKTLVNTVALAIVIVLIAATAYGLYWGGGYLWQRLALVDAPTRALLLAGAATAILVALIVAAGRQAAARHAARGRLAQDRLRLYRQLLTRYRSAAGGAATDPPASDELDVELALLGTGAVIEAHAKLAEALRTRDATAELLEEQLANLLRAMRRDLGQDDGYTPAMLGAEAAGHFCTTGATSSSSA